MNRANSIRRISWDSDGCRANVLRKVHVQQSRVALQAWRWTRHGVDIRKKPRELADLNPYNNVPTMVDRDLVLYDSHIINEYLDERLPHPPLMPVDPVNRARARLMLMRFDRDWCSLLPDLFSSDKKRQQNARTVLRDGLTVISPLFKELQFILGEEYSLVDCSLAPILWRLPLYQIELPRQAKPILDYADRLFARKSFKLSLTDAEREMRPRAK